MIQVSLFGQVMGLAMLLWSNDVALADSSQSHNLFGFFQALEFRDCGSICVLTCLVGRHFIPVKSARNMKKIH